MPVYVKITTQKKIRKTKKNLFLVQYAKNADITSPESSQVIGTGLHTLSPEIFRGKAVKRLNIILDFYDFGMANRMSNFFHMY